jgi:hypothetical protein
VAGCCGASRPSVSAFGSCPRGSDGRKSAVRLAARRDDLEIMAPANPVFCLNRVLFRKGSLEKLS